MEIPTLTEVISLLAAGGGAGAILSFLFEHFAFFQSLTSKAKWWLVFLTTILLPVVATAVLQFMPADVWSALQPYWASLAAGFVVWGGTQIAHKFVNKKGA